MKKNWKFLCLFMKLVKFLFAHEAPSLHNFNAMRKGMTMMSFVRGGVVNEILEFYLMLVLESHARLGELLGCALISVLE